MLTHIKTLAVTGFLAAIVFPIWAQEEKSPPSKGCRIEGTYQVIALERDGKPVPEENYRGHSVQITGDRITSLNKDNKEVLAVTYKIDSSTTPYKIATVSILPIKDMKTNGLIEANGDTIRLICNTVGGPTPTAFKTVGPDQQMVTLKAIAKSDKLTDR